MLRLIGLVLLATVAVGYFAPEFQRLAELGPDKDAAPTSAPKPAPAYGRVSIAADARGHFLVNARINGRLLPLLADTGATLVSLRASDARDAGMTVIPGDYTASVSTANGTVGAARVTIQDIEIGGIRMRGVQALVLPDTALATNLLGMSFLGRLSAFNIGDGRLDLIE